jgi:hypothetical protein
MYTLFQCCLAELFFAVLFQNEKNDAALVMFKNNFAVS